MQGVQFTPTLLKTVMTPPTNNFILLQQTCLNIHIKFNSYQMNMIPLLFQSIQLILSLKSIGNNQHIAQATQIPNLGGHRLFYLSSKLVELK